MVATNPSPGIYLREQQVIPTSLATAVTTPLIIGGATRGPLDRPVIASSELELFSLLGPPVAGDYGILTAIEAFKRGNRVMYLRVADATARVASRTLQGRPISVAGVKASGRVAMTVSPQDGDTVAIPDALAVTKTYEMDLATASTGSLTLTGNPSDGAYIQISDGFVVKTVEYDTATAAIWSVDLTAQPADANTVTILDIGGVSRTFEYESAGGVTAGNVAVVIGATAPDTRNNLLAAITAQAALGLRVSAAVGGANEVLVTMLDVGTGSLVSRVGANITITNPTPGENLAASIAGATPSRIVTGDNTQMAANLAAAINSIIGFNITAVAASAVVTLTNTRTGTRGNQTITSVGTVNTTLAGMAGGTDNSVTSGNIAVAIGATDAVTASNLAAAINSTASFLVSALADLTSTPPAVVVTAKNVGIAGNQTITITGGRMTTTSLTGGVDEVRGSAVDVLTIQAIETGSWFNTMQVRLAATTVIPPAAEAFDLIVLAPSENGGSVISIVERFRNVSMSPTDARYVERVVSEGIRGEFEPSRYIRALGLQPYRPDTGDFLVSFGQTGLDGITGLVSTDYIGSSSGGVATGLAAASNVELLDFDILSIPGVSHNDVITAIFNLCELRRDCYALIDPPIGLTPAEVVDWHNGLLGTIPNTPTARLDTHFASPVYPWWTLDSPHLGRRVSMPMSAGAIGAFLFNDVQSGQWYAPAGFNRGTIPDVVRLDYNVTRTDRDLLLSEGNAVIPVIQALNATGQSVFLLFGDKTLQRAAGPLQNVNVTRLTLFLGKRLGRLLRNYLFDPNDPTLWRSVEMALTPIMEDLAARRAFSLIDNTNQPQKGFRVQCDATTNPPDQRRRGTMLVKVTISPLAPARDIVIEFSVLEVGGRVDIQTTVTQQ